MTGLPQGWASPAIENLATIKMGKTVLSKDLTQSGLPVYSAGAEDKPWGYLDGHAATCRQGTVVVSARGSIGFPKLPKHAEFISTQTTISVTPSDAVVPEFLLQALKRLDYGELSSGAAIPMLTVGKLCPIEIPLPPLPEQRRIVRKLDTLSARSTTARTHLTFIEKLVERYKLAVLAAHTLSAEQSNPDWKEVTLERVRDPKAPIRYGVVQPGTIKDEGVPLVRVCDLMGGRVQWSELRRVSAEIDEAYANARIQDGDVLVSVVGTIGRVALVGGVAEPTNIARAVSRIRPNRMLVEPSWLFWRLNAPDAQARFDGNVREVARKTLNIGLIKETPFKLPPVDEQREIVRRIETAFAKIDRLAAEAQKALKLLSHLDQRILAKAFAGDLVPQDPTDEPAETLLARIRATRAVVPRSTRGRKRST